MTDSQLRQLATPFPASLVKKPPKGKYGAYVNHATYTERLLSILGPFTFGVTEIVRGYAPAVGKDDKFPARDNAIVGCLATLEVFVDGQYVTITEVGTEDTPAMHNDAENLKNATSDALKRCAMRLGLGLHLWSQSDYFLDKQLDKHDPNHREKATAGEGAAPETIERIVESMDPEIAIPRECPKCGRDSLRDNRSINVERVIAGKPPWPRASCVRRDECGFVSWNGAEWRDEGVEDGSASE